MKPLLFCLSSHASLLGGALDEGSGCELAVCEPLRFPNGEMYLRLDRSPAGRICGALGSLAPPDEQMLSLLLLAHTLKQEGAQRVIAVLPYLGYARQDRAEPRQSLGIRWAGSLLHAAGVDHVVTLDVHSDEATRLAVPLSSVSPAPLFAEVLARTGLQDMTVLAPDEGARERCERVRRATGVAAPVAYLRKRRDAHGVTHSALVGSVTSRVAIVDDILDTGGTLISACLELQRRGVAEIVVLASHGVFTGERWLELSELGLRRIYISDSVPSALTRADGLVKVLPVGELVIGAFFEIAARQHERLPETTTRTPGCVELIEGPAPAEDSSVP